MPVKPTNSNYFQYNRSLQGFANDLRKRMTHAEVRLWKNVLSNRQMAGYQFRRQRPVLNYISDFACLDLRLIIEVDGHTHEFAEVQERDKIRQANLEGSGWTVLRLTDWKVLNEIGDVRDEIYQWIVVNAYCPPPPPRQRGRHTTRK